MIKQQITDKRGRIYVIPMDMDVAGIAFNKNVLDAAKVDPYSIKTWSDFKIACQKIKEMGKTPVYIGGCKDDWTVGNFFDCIAPSFLITNPSKNYRAQLKEGTFDWNNWKMVAQLLLDFQKAGYLNKNIKEGTWPEVAENLAKGNAAFAPFGNYIIGEAYKYKSDVSYGFMPIPSNSPDDPPTVIVGERSAFGVWKDSENKDIAIKFIEYLSNPENINKIASGNMTLTGLTGEEYGSDTGMLDASFEKIKICRGFGYFDREYLPSGMWDSMCKTGTGLLTGTMNTITAANKMKTDFNILRSQ
jgi:raffinose/stachyose/melibiose transport system substrate-binding protein